MKKTGLFRPLSLKPEAVDTKKFWMLHVLDNAFRFSLFDSDTEWFVEHDKLVSMNAYKGLKPLNMKEMLDHLEKSAPGYFHIAVNTQLYLIRTRMQSSPGLLLRWKEEDVLWLEDTHLSKLNFLDFYQKELLPKTEKSLIVRPVDNLLPTKEEEKQNGEKFIN